MACPVRAMTTQRMREGERSTCRNDAPRGTRTRTMSHSVEPEESMTDLALTEQPLPELEAQSTTLPRSVLTNGNSFEHSMSETIVTDHAPLK